MKEQVMDKNQAVRAMLAKSQANGRDVNRESFISWVIALLDRIEADGQGDYPVTDVTLRP